MNVAADRSRSTADRPDALRRLQAMLGTHLDQEERDAVPLIRAHIDHAEWDERAHLLLRACSRWRLALLIAWACSAGSPEQVREAINAFPARLRILFRVHWWRAYRRRYRRLYVPPASPRLSRHDPRGATRPANSRRPPAAWGQLPIR